MSARGGNVEVKTSMMVKIQTVEIVDTFARFLRKKWGILRSLYVDTVEPHH